MATKAELEHALEIAHNQIEDLQEMLDAAPEAAVAGRGDFTRCRDALEAAEAARGGFDLSTERHYRVLLERFTKRLQGVV